MKMLASIIQSAQLLDQMLEARLPNGGTHPERYFSNPWLPPSWTEQLRLQNDTNAWENAHMAGGTRAVRMVLSGRLRGTYRQSGGTDRNKTEKDKRLECRYFEDIEVLTAKAAK